MQHNRNVHPAEQLAQAMRRIYAKGYTTTSGGNLSLRDKDGSLWITPTAVDKGTLSEDILHVLCDGTVRRTRYPAICRSMRRCQSAPRPKLRAACPFQGAGGV
ncbi:MAG: class II aldolase/adducin family protein [Christensenellales bacterium]